MNEPRTGVGVYLVAVVGAFLIMFFMVRAMQHYTVPPPLANTAVKP